MITIKDQKILAVVKRYCTSEFTESNWQEIGQITNCLKIINDHPRLLRSMSFGDDDYDACVADVLHQIVNSDIQNLNIIIEYYEINVWYKKIEPIKYEKIFNGRVNVIADFWSETNARLFFSHLAESRDKVGALAREIKSWGVETFVAHDDIEPSLIWLTEIEKALATMDAMVAVVERKFIESKWCDQEVGYAFGRGVNVFPLRCGADPYGLLGSI